jgi:hypothetical protein
MITLEDLQILQSEMLKVRKVYANGEAKEIVLGNMESCYRILRRLIDKVNDGTPKS